MSAYFNPTVFANLQFTLKWMGSFDAPGVEEISNSDRERGFISYLLRLRARQLLHRVLFLRLVHFIHFVQLLCLCARARYMRLVHFYAFLYVHAFRALYELFCAFCTCVLSCVSYALCVLRVSCVSRVCAFVCLHSSLQIFMLNF